MRIGIDSRMQRSRGGHRGTKGIIWSRDTGNGSGGDTTSRRERIYTILLVVVVGELQSDEIIVHAFGVAQAAGIKVT